MGTLYLYTNNCTARGHDKMGTYICTLITAEHVDTMKWALCICTLITAEHVDTIKWTSYICTLITAQHVDTIKWAPIFVH
jgi:hypothetical protein